MSNNLRASGHTILTRIMLLFIVMTFALWGIGDIFRSGGRGVTIATVGDVKISAQEYLQAVRNRQEEVRQRLGKMYTPELLKSLGLEEQALDGVINRNLLQMEAAANGLTVGEDSIVDHIASMQEFRDTNGRFSKDLFQATLRANRLTEKDYIAAMSEQISSKLLLTTIASGITPTEDLVYALYRARAEKRKASLLTIPSSAVAQDTAVSDADIKAYYEQNTERFMVPERRAFSYVEMKPEDAKPEVLLSDADIARTYEERAASYAMPERRVVEQVVFEKKEDAEKANEAISKQGKSLKDVAASFKVMNKDKLLLGELTKDRVPVGADEVFSLKEGQISRPYESPFGWHIMQVTKILPAGQKPLAEVKDSIVSELTARAAQETLFKRSNRFEDLLGGGKSFEQAAQEMGLAMHNVEAVSSDGLNASGGKAALPVIGNLLDTVFSTAEKDHSRMIQSDSGSYFMVQVNTVDKAHAKPLAEVEAEVKAALIRQQYDKKLKALASDLVKELRSGKAPEEALKAKGLNAAFEAAGLMQRNSDTVEEGKLKGRVLPDTLIKDLYSVAKGQYTGVHALPEGGYMIARVDEVVPAADITTEPTDGSSPLTSIREELKQSLSNETQYYYLQYLRKKHPVTINQEALKALANPNG